MKLKSMLALLGLAFTTSVFADQQIPDRCPSVGALKSAEFEHVAVLPDGPNWVVVGGFNKKYDTNTDWTFVVIVENENDEIETRDAAYEYARQSLDTLGFVSGPDYIELTRSYGCSYQSATPNTKILVVNKIF